ncbi:MAG: HlyD family secretion protein [Clostridium sp.]|jgi:HlyD family secretion protein|nr:HlyD family secretion protein [Clostridium sp.]
MITVGTPLATILPNGESEYRVQLYVDSKDIVGIETGSPVKFEIPALPSQIYGDLYGQVVHVSRDTKSINSQQTNYYLVECSIHNRKLFDKNGNEAKIEVGMIGKGFIIVREIRIIDYIFQKLDFLIP